MSRLLTPEEYMARGMLLGYPDYYADKNWYRKRTGDGRFAGCAEFSYYDADTLKLIITRSELDRPTYEG